MRERGERREKSKTLTEAAGDIYIKKLCQKKVLRVTKWRGLILANTRDKEVIHQNEVGLH